MRIRDERVRLASCLNKANPDEMIFVLLGRDAAAPYAIREWIKQRIAMGKNKPGDAQLLDAEACAATMESERTAGKIKL